MGNVCTQGPAEVETPNQPSFQSLLQEQKAKEETPEKLAEKQNQSMRLGLSAETEDTEATVNSANRNPNSTESRKDEEILAECQKMEAIATEVENLN